MYKIYPCDLDRMGECPMKYPFYCKCAECRSCGVVLEDGDEEQEDE